MSEEAAVSFLQSYFLVVVVLQKESQLFEAFLDCLIVASESISIYSRGSDVGLADQSLLGFF